MRKTERLKTPQLNCNRQRIQKIKENAKSRVITVNSLLLKPEDIKADFEKFVLTRPTDFGTQNNHM